MKKTVACGLAVGSGCRLVGRRCMLRRRHEPYVAANLFAEPCDQMRSILRKSSAEGSRQRRRLFPEPLYVRVEVSRLAASPKRL